MVLKVAPVLLLIACASPQVVAPASGGTIALALVIDGPQRQQHRLAGGLAQRMNCRGHQLLRIGSEKLDAARSLSKRIEALRKISKDSRFVALAELHPRYQNQVAGRFRWEVSVRLAVSPNREGAQTSNQSFTLPALLMRSNEGAEEALDAVMDEVSERFDSLVHRVVQGDGAGAQPRLVYLALIDRFFDGDSSNNGTIDRQDPQAWHGGDLAGIEKKLPHLQALGVTDLWLTPMFAARQERFHEHGAFHAYWTHDLRQIEPRFGDLKAAKSLRRATRKAGIKLHLDLVTNHVAWDAPLRQKHADWFHADKAITDPQDAQQRETGWVHGLPDLAQENPAVSEYLIGSAKYWQDLLQPDGFRLDALTHVPTRFVRNLAAALGAKTELLGEFYEGRAQQLSQRMQQAGIDQAFDFPLHFALVQVFCGDAPVEQLATVLALDRLYKNPERLLTFLDNHDRPRLASLCQGEQARIHQAIAMLFALRGTPVITYGTESGLSGSKEPDNRADMRFEAAHPTFKHLQKMLDLRRRTPILTAGKTLVLGAESERLRMLRYNDDRAVWVAVNRASSALQLNLDLPPGLRFKTTSSAILAPYQLRIERLSIVDPAAFRRWRTERKAPRKIEFTVNDLEQSDLLLVGSSPELGSWQIDKAIALQPKGKKMSATVLLPGDGMVAVKLVRRDGNWSPRANQYLMPADQNSPVEMLW
ncbi:MAG: alpha-amylase family glycosyl hydrolase [Myxococcota bacterium]|nr:alpha-amylase family glycosyl hydrolase [Myxococcota bacterium]